MLVHIVGAIVGAIAGVFLGTMFLMMLWNELVDEDTRERHPLAEYAIFVTGHVVGITAGVAVARLPIALDAHLAGSCACGLAAGIVDVVRMYRARHAYGMFAALVIGTAAGAYAAAIVSLLV